MKYEPKLVTKYEQLLDERLRPLRRSSKRERSNFEFAERIGGGGQGTSGRPIFLTRAW
jgi:hypothetical protein